MLEDAPGTLRVLLPPVRSLLPKVLLILGFCALSCSPAPAPGPAPVPTPPVRATLKALKGDVMVKRGAGDEWTRGREGQSLYETDKVRTSAGSVQISFPQGGTVSLGDNSLIGIAEAGGANPGDLTVLQGR